MKINEVTGDVTEPVVSDGMRCIVHCTNQHGVWGSGVVIPIKNKWPEAYTKNLLACKLGGVFNDILNVKVQPRQGHIQPVLVENNLIIVNAFAQSGMGDFFELPACRYQAFNECCIRIREYLIPAIEQMADIPQVLPTFEKKVSLHFPAILCGLAGGREEMVKLIILSTFGDYKGDIPLEIYWYNFNG